MKKKTTNLLKEKKGSGLPEYERLGLKLPSSKKKVRGKRKYTNK